jgi:uncharacterized protein (UPF0333 family)
VSALAWPLVALVAIGVAAYLANRWLNRSVDVDAAHRLLADSMHKTEQVAWAAKAAAEKTKPEVIQELDDRVRQLEMAAGLRSYP